MTRILLRCGQLAGPVFLGTAVAEGLRRPDYRALRHPISSLALGQRGVVQVANFVSAGALCAAFAAGLIRARPAPTGTRTAVSTGKSVPATMAISAAGLLACAVFPADPVNGYPPGTPAVPVRLTPVGYAHVLASSMIMVGVPGTMAVYARLARRADQRRWAVVSSAGAVLTAGFFAAASAGFAQVWRLAPVAGALQRAGVTVGFAWLGALATRTLRADNADPAR